MTGNNLKFLGLRALILMLGLLGLFTVGNAQITDSTTVSAPYRLQREDVLTIQVFGQPQITSQVTVGQTDGRISPLFIDSIPAAGKTLDQLKADLTEKYRTQMLLRDPIVGVTIVSYRPLRAFIGGSVQKTGLVVIRPGDTVLELYNQGGGAIPDMADLRRAFLKRSSTSSSKELIPIDLYAMTVLGDMSQNYEIHDGDELEVPEQRNNRIIVQGQVQRPGQYVYHEPMTLEDAIALAGGEVRYRSKFSHTIVMRQKPGLPGEYVTIVADLVRFVKKGDQSQNIALQPGDFVYVPDSDSPDFNQIAALFNVAYIFNLITGGNVFNRIFTGF